MLINFFGKRGAGKTTAIKGQLQDCRPPVVVLDVLGNFQDVHAFHTSSLSQAIQTLAYYVRTKDPKYRTIVLQTQNPTDACDYMSSALWHVNGGTLVLDEVDAFSISEAECFDQLVRYGRNRNVDLITGCRRPAELSKNITAGANKLFAFGTHEPRDIDYFESTVFGEEAMKLMSVPKFSGLFVDYDSQTSGLFRIDIQGGIYLNVLKRPENKSQGVKKPADKSKAKTEPGQQIVVEPEEPTQPNIDASSVEGVSDVS